VTEAGWERGDLLGQDFPVHLEALRAAGPAFLTEAFRAAGSLGATNAIALVTLLEAFDGGSTGRKAVLAVTYEHPDPELPEQLFVKFSRDLDNELRDRGKGQMASEVRFGLLSHIPDFPVAVPRCLFGEYNLESGSGLLITERIAFGINGIERHYPKARDYELEDPRAHYDVLVSALGRLAGSHRAGRFPPEAMSDFEPGPAKVTSRQRRSSTTDEVRARVTLYAEFAAQHPQLLPASIRSDTFIAQMYTEVPRSVEHAGQLRAALRDSAGGLSAFCHWNANIDNAWFWHDESGALACGLMDWGNVSVMNMVSALSSALVFAEPDFVIENLDHFFALFSEVFEDAGGGPLDPAGLRLQFSLQMVAGGLEWPLGIVPLIERHLPDLAAAADRFDPRIEDDEFARTQLHLLTAYLMLWQASEPRDLIDWAIRRADDAPNSVPVQV
jgi:hypothetical protein